ncbi:MAG: hypothetical protein J7497_16355 [Chitinophagaceae bacterium]|nr:hypothetical protein [Chitinophagaceae bacterium]
MLRIEDIVFMLVFIAIGALIGFVIGKHNRKVPRNKVLIDKGTFDFLRERNEELSALEEEKENKTRRSPIMYFVRGHMWNN